MMSEPRRQIKPSWISGDKQITVEWLVHLEEVLIQTHRYDKSIFIHVGDIDSLIKALQALKEKMSEAEL